jgi:hypothetical protein
MADVIMSVINTASIIPQVAVPIVASPKKAVGAVTLTPAKTVPGTAAPDGIPTDKPPGLTNPNSPA